VRVPIDPLKNQVRSFIRRVASEQARMALIGQPAFPLETAAWVNGDPLTDADLKGKVVLLDFWAVWCGPCIACFPHLRDWHEKYADRGLVIVGLTKYYSCRRPKPPKRAKALRPAPRLEIPPEPASLVGYLKHFDKRLWAR
jgi:thiol-disulfide isomerase/thioredoxin